MKISILILAIVIGLGLMSVNYGPKVVRGQVIDSVTTEGIEGVTVRAAQRGWGFAVGGSLVWDKDYDTTVMTGRDGRFSLWYYRGGTSVHLQFSKDGYRSTKPGYPLQDTYIDFWEKPIVKLERN